MSDVISPPYRAIRAILDYGYHSNYSLSRQNLQDQIVADLLSTSTVTDMVSGVTCSTPTDPWIVFTAGGMGAGKSYTIGSLMKYSARSAAAVGRPPARSVALNGPCAAGT
jgi:chloramphenicol 3-O-phosphotransferase